jgi:anti-sigma regulatory factor (Ser/Thr protein kinase)
VIDHAYHGLGESDEHRPTRLSNDADFPHVGVLISIAPDSLTITVSDRGRGSTGKFDSSAANLDEYSSRERPRGLGLFIIRKLMDDVRVDFPEPSGTRLVMTKLLQPTRESRQFAEGH